MKWVLRNYIKIKREFRIFYKKKTTGVLLEIILSNIKKKLKLRELAKGNKQAI